jgi:hypothetical protein
MPESDEKVYRKEAAKVVQYLEQEHYSASTSSSLAELLS